MHTEREREEKRIHILYPIPDADAKTPSTDHDLRPNFPIRPEHLSSPKPGSGFPEPKSEEVDESGISTTENVKPSEVKKDPSSIPLSKEGRKILESHSPKPRPVVSSLRSQLERCQREVKRTISGGNLISKIKEPLVQTKSLPIRSVHFGSHII